MPEKTTAEMKPTLGLTGLTMNAMALIAPVRGPALHTFFPGSETSCLEITPKSAWLSGHASGIEESVAEIVEDLGMAWRQHQRAAIVRDRLLKAARAMKCECKIRHRIHRSGIGPQCP